MNRIVIAMLFVMLLMFSFDIKAQQAGTQPSLSTGIDSVLNGISSVGGDFVFDEGKMVSIPNTNIKIQPPDYFMYSESVPGFVHVGTMSSIQVEEVVGTSYLLISMAMDSAYFASQGMTLISSEPVVMHDGSEGILFTAEMKLQGFVFERLVLMSGDYHYTIWINAGYIKMLSSKLRPVVLQSILTSKIYE